jgi:gliding motility-associated-like protein
LECLNDPCQQVSATPLSTTLYQVLVKDINGCLATDDINISVARTSNVYVPNAFSPNGNFPGNRTFKVFAGTGVSTVDFIRIYDRWGNLVHAEEAAQPRLLSGVGTWNGYYNNDNTKELNAGVYVYVVQVSFTDGGNPELRRGNVTLIR